MDAERKTQIRQCAARFEMHRKGTRGKSWRNDIRDIETDNGLLVARFGDHIPDQYDGPSLQLAMLAKNEPVPELLSELLDALETAEKERDEARAQRDEARQKPQSAGKR